MKLNCKAGDLAVVVRSFTGNEGRVMRVIRFVGACSMGRTDDWWETDTETTGCFGTTNKLFPDNQLRPIRDNPGNEHWVTEARNKLKGKTEITERGEVSA